MPQEQNTIDPAYKKGFELGYWMQRGNSSQLEQAMKNSASNPQYQSGLKEGREQALRELAIERLAKAKEAQTKRNERGR